MSPLPDKSETRIFFDASAYRGAEVGTGKGRAGLILTVAGLRAPDLGQRIGVVLARQTARPDPGGLERQAGPPPLVAPRLDRVRRLRLELNGTRPQVVGDLGRVQYNISIHY